MEAADGAQDGPRAPGPSDEVLEVGIGLAILGLRQLNMARRDLVTAVPTLAPAVDAVLERIDEIAPPLSAAVAGVVTSVADALPDSDQAQAVRDLGATLAEVGPELIRLSGLTRRG